MVRVIFLRRSAAALMTSSLALFDFIGLLPDDPCIQRRHRWPRLIGINGLARVPTLMASGEP